MGNRIYCDRCGTELQPHSLFHKTIHGQNVVVCNEGHENEFYKVHDHHECKSCFYKTIRDQEEMRREEEKRREETRRREEEKMREEARRREEEKQREEKMKKEQQRAREAEEKKRQEELNQRLKESHKQAEKQHEQQLSRYLLDKEESKQHVLKSNLKEFEQSDKSGSDSDQLLEILSSKCSIPVPKLSLAHMTADQMGNFLLVLDKLLFDEWVSDPPSLSTLQHTQVFITELSALSLEKSEVSLESISNQIQSLMESISQSAVNVSESLLLAQALYITLMDFKSNHSSCDSDAALIAKQWAEDDLSTEDLYLIEFLGTLMLSLQNVVGRASVFILKMEVQCFKFLLDILKHLNDKDNHTESTKILLMLVQTNQWTPVEAVTLLKVLSEKYVEDATITEVLKLVHVYDISPEWTDDSGHSFIQALEFVDPERFQQDFPKALRQQDASSLDSEK